ncbi:hypothetical protein FE257_010412 [Aspergillus nanangensis]|uniref:CREG-like beta-barrel domain-containing protein n=1 Tax=Aspergillus nanangensis TaxID=2582783 RepID=A0AAD4CIP8_ASPNN|nr:hypothetical protein FE257_010412 [Aspergillus nanangensis]
MARLTIPLISSLAVLSQLAHVITATPFFASEQALLDSTSDSSPSIEDTIHVTASDNLDPATAPSWFTSTLMARRLLALSTTGVASTVFPSPLSDNSHAPDAVAGHSIPLTEYFADCDATLPDSASDGGSGNPTFLALHVATTFRNTAAGSNISLSIDWWDHVDATHPLFPGFPLSAAGLPRVTLFGYIDPLETPIPKALQECYLAAHPDAKVWLPGKQNSPHASFWARMVVTQVYWIGGFGGFQQIGWMNVTEWKGIRKGGSLSGIGDGRGWDDVKLPGEKE